MVDTRLLNGVAVAGSDFSVASLASLNRSAVPSTVIRSAWISIGARRPLVAAQAMFSSASSSTSRMLGSNP